jgi:hypothetical protein
MREDLALSQITSNSSLSTSMNFDVLCFSAFKISSQFQLLKYLVLIILFETHILEMFQRY